MNGGNAQREAEPDYRARAAAVREDLLRFDLSKQHLKVLLWIVELSYGWGLESIRIPKLGVLKELTGMSVANLSTTIKELHGMRLLLASRAEGGVDYKVQPDCDRWHCRPLTTCSTVQHAKDWLKVYNLGESGAKVVEAFVPVELDYPPNQTSQTTEE
jgi:phage replication O-like protein O